MRLEPHGLVLERRHVREGDGLARAADEGVELVVDVGAHLRREGREGRRLQEVAVLGVLLHHHDDAELELLVGGHDRAAVELRGFVHFAQRRTAAVLTPEVEDEGPDAQRVLGELESGNVLRHGPQIRCSREHGLQVLGDRAVAREHDEAVERAQEPPVVGDRDDRADERRERLFQRLGGGEVEVVGGLVEQEQVRAGQFEQEDLQSGLLAARQRLERLPSRTRAGRSGGVRPWPGRDPARPSSPRRAPRHRGARADRASARSIRGRRAHRAARYRRDRPARPRAAGGSGSCRCRSGRAPRRARRTRSRCRTDR